jgi:nitrate reductase NapE component
MTTLKELKVSLGSFITLLVFLFVVFPPLIKILNLGLVGACGLGFLIGWFWDRMYRLFVGPAPTKDDK